MEIVAQDPVAANDGSGPTSPKSKFGDARVSGPRVAIVHEWLVSVAGSERVVEQMLKLFPESVLHVLFCFLQDSQSSFVDEQRLRTTFLQKFPFAKHYHRALLPLMPIAVEQFDLSEFDLVISSNHAVAKGVLTRPGQPHICYVHSPIRYAWDMQHTYLRNTKLSTIGDWYVRWLLHRIRQWDVRTANGVDMFVANSRFIAKRIWKVYRRHAAVIHPPVSVDAFPLCENKEHYYVTLSRLVPYKRVDLLVKAFGSLPNERLIVIGDGPELSRLRRIASPNISFVGYQPLGVVSEYLQRARAFLYAAEEDFGIVLAEAQACGTPVVAYGRGGASDSVRPIGCDEPTGVLFSEQSVEAVLAAIGEFNHRQDQITPANCQKNALRFSQDRFRSELESVVGAVWRSSGEVCDFDAYAKQWNLQKFSEPKDTYRK